MILALPLPPLMVERLFVSKLQDLSSYFATLKWCRMDEMMRGQRGWRELAILGDKMDKISGMIEGFIWSPKGSEANNQVDDWPPEEVFLCTIPSCYGGFTFLFCFEVDMRM